MVPGACNYDCVGNADDTVGCGYPYKIQVFSTNFLPILCSQTSDPDGQKVASGFTRGISSYANTPATYVAGETPATCAEWKSVSLDKSGLDPGFVDPVKGSTNMISKIEL